MGSPTKTAARKAIKEKSHIGGMWAIPNVPQGSACSAGTGAGSRSVKQPPTNGNRSPYLKKKKFLSTSPLRRHAYLGCLTLNRSRLSVPVNLKSRAFA